MVFLILRCAGYGVIFSYNNMCEILENTMIDPIIITFFYHAVLAYSDGAVW